MSLVKRTYVDGETVITAENLNDIQDAIIENKEAIEAQGEAIEGKYTKPSGGIPSTDLASGVQTSLGKADTAYQKPSGGIPSTDLASAVQTSLGKADTALQSSDIDSTLTVSGKAADAKKTGDEISGVKNTLNHKADVIYDTASGPIASFPDGADGLPVKDLTVGIEPAQDLHGYENPWPAGGGKNLLPLVVSDIKSLNTAGTWSGNSYSYNGVTFTINTDSDGNVIGISTSGTATGAAKIDLYHDETDNTVFQIGRILNGCPAGGSAGTDGYKLSAWGNPANVDTGSGITITYKQSWCSINVYNGVNVNGKVFYPMVRLSSVSDATFAPYSNICPISGWTGCNISHSGADTSDPTVFSISWQSEAGTVYGGTLDVTSGVLTVTYRCVDMGTLPFSRSNENLFYVMCDDLQAVKNENRLSEWKSSIYKNGGSRGVAQITDGMMATNSDRYIMFKDTRTDVATEFKNLVTGQTLFYPLATPLVYNLDPVTVTTLLGQNNIWADCGPSTVEYPCDTKLYIERLTAPEEDDMIANQNIASGVYFMVGNNLYLSTAAILAGDPIKPGTNCTLTNLAAALNALNS